MANTQLFGSKSGSRNVKQADTVNNASGKAYSMASKHALAQLASTGCFNNTFYQKAEDQLKAVLEHAQKCDDLFLAQVAVYAREKAYMKDMPAMLCAVLAARKTDTAREYLKEIFPRVIDNGKMLRNFVQILRSGVTGRKSLGQFPKRLVNNWLNGRNPEKLFHDSVGESPSLADVIRMTHPAPATPVHNALYSYLLGHKPLTNGETPPKAFYNPENLPANVKAFEAWKKDQSLPVPQVDFRMLTAQPLDKATWIQIARNANWQMARMNLNTFKRHGVFESKEMVELIANKLRDEKAIRDAKVFPYQLLMAYMAVDDMPTEITEALQDAMEFAVSNIPVFDGNVVVCADVSGSMSSPVTGQRAGATSKVRCIDVAALVSASVLRTNKLARVIPFEHTVVDTKRLSLNPRDSIMTNAKKLAGIGGGGTNCSAPLQLLNKENAKVDLVIYVSDNESWVDRGRYCGGTGTQVEWDKIRARNPNAKLVNIDITPNTTLQTTTRPDILNIGGFSDTVFTVIDAFQKSASVDTWVTEIENIRLGG